MSDPRLLVLSGSIRAGSLNTALAHALARSLAQAGATVTVLSLADYPLPIYNGDDEAQSGAPANAVALRAQFVAHSGVFLACPEYNAGPSALMKNTIDWLSRVRDPGPSPFKAPVFALGAASPGGFGGYRGLMVMRQILELGLGATVLTDMISLPRAHTAFQPDGSLADEAQAKLVIAVAARLITEASRSR